MPANLRILDVRKDRSPERPIDEELQDVCERRSRLIEEREEGVPQAWPTLATPKPAVRSTKRLPSTSQTFAPRARSQKIGGGERQVTLRLSHSASRRASASEPGPGTGVTSAGRRDWSADTTGGV
jgi:hypothetical protein